MIIAFRKKLKLLTGLAVASALTVSAMGLIGLQWKTDREQAEQRFLVIGCALGGRLRLGDVAVLI